MNDLHVTETSLKRTRIGILLMLVSFFLGIVVAVGSFVSMSGHLDSDVMFLIAWGLANLGVDYTKGLYPVLLVLGYAGGLAYILAYASLLKSTNVHVGESLICERRMKK